MPSDDARRKRILVALLVAALGAMFVAFACRPAPLIAPVGRSADVVLPELRRLPFRPPETLSYEFGWNGAPVAKLTLRTRNVVTADGREAVEMAYEGGTLPLLDHIWRLRASGSALLDPATLRPRSAEMVSEAPRKQKRVTMRFDRRARTAHVHLWQSREGKEKEKDVELDAQFDPASALLLARLGLAAAEEALSVRMVSGDEVYEIVFVPVGPEEMKAPAGTFQTTRYDMGARKLGEDGTGAPEAEQKYRSIRLWVASDGGVPVKIECDIALGHVYAVLVRRVVGPEAAEGGMLNAEP